MKSTDCLSDTAVVRAITLLRQTVIELDAETDQLNQAVADLEELLRILKPGVAAWATIAVRDGVGGWSRAIGYTKVSGRWGFAIRERKGEGAEVDETIWPFNEAARWMRLDAAAHFGALFEAIVQRVDEMSAAMRKRTEQVRATILLVKQGVENGRLNASECGTENRNNEPGETR